MHLMLFRVNTNLIAFCKLDKKHGVYVDKVSIWNRILCTGLKESRPRENKSCVKLAKKESCFLNANTFLANKKIYYNRAITENYFF